jgi:hypothetical protein
MGGGGASNSSELDGNSARTVSLLIEGFYLLCVVKRCGGGNREVKSLLKCLFKSAYPSL